MAVLPANVITNQDPLCSASKLRLELLFETMASGAWVVETTVATMMMISNAAGVDSDPN